MRNLLERIAGRIRYMYWSYPDRIFAKIITFFTRNKPLQDVIVLESHNDFDCNAGAFYDYLLKHHYNEKYKIVWYLKNPVPRSLPKNVKGYRFFRPGFMRTYYRCVAKIIANDNVFIPKARADQRLFYLTHGCITFKNVKGLIVVPEYMDYILSGSSFYDPYVCENYSIPYPNQKMLHFGYPCNDCFYQDTPDEFQKISKEQYDHIILWMPTFRKGGGPGRNDSTAIQPLGIPLIEDLETYKNLNAFLQSRSMFLIIKIHPNQDLSDLNITDLSNIKVVTAQTAKALDLDNSRLMKCSDAVISDYSSAAFQYLLLNRPIAFVLSDFKEYKRGLIVDDIASFFLGDFIYTYDDLTGFLEHVSAGSDRFFEKRTELRSLLYAYQDGNACKRLAEFMEL